MADTEIPTLEVGFAINPEGSFASLQQLQDVMHSTEGKIVAEAARIEKATGGMVNVAGATAAMTSFGTIVSKESRSAALELSRIEKAGEALVRQLERQNATFGKSRDELRLMKVEAAATAAEEKGLTDLAVRLRAQEADLHAQELAEMRRLRQEAEALAEDRAMAAQQAVAAAEREAQALRDAGFAHQMFEARVRAGAKAMREEEAAERDLITRTMALKSAIDPAFAAQQRFDREIAEARMLMAAGTITLDDYAKRHWQLQQAMQQSTAAMHGQVAGSRMAKAGYQQLTMQANDAITMYSMQATLMQIFVSQIGQVFQALQMVAEGSEDASKGTQILGKTAAATGVGIDGLGGKTAATGSKLMAAARFMTGPWGAAAMIATVALAPLLAKLIDTNDALDDAVKKLKEQAKESDISRQAQERFRTSAEGVAAAIRDGTQATKDSMKSLESSAIQANAKARENHALTISIREATIAEIEHAKVLAENAKSRNIFAGGPGGAQSIVANQYAAEVERLDKLLAKQKVDIAAAEARINVTNIDVAFETAARMTDPIAKINKVYDDQVTALKRTAIARAQGGQAIDANVTALAAEFARIEQNRNAAVKAEQDRQSAVKQTNNEIGRTISLLEARAIAEKAGGRVTSDLRSREEQQGLYDKYMAYKNGTGPWAALAAKPGSSNHERGLALDVAKTDGMTLKKLVSAYRAAGVKLTEALDEGSHFHIAWSQNKAVETAAKEADKIVEMMQDQVTKAYANVWDQAQAMDKRNAEWGQGEPTLGSKMIQEDKDAADLLRAQQELRSEVIDAFMADLDRVSDRVDDVAANMRNAFGSVGGAIGDLVTVLDEYGKRQAEIDKQREMGGLDEKQLAILRQQESSNQLSGMIALTSAAKGLFKEHSAGYKAMVAAEKALTIMQLARTAIDVAGGAARMFATLGPFAFPAVAAMLGVMAALGFGGSTANTLPKSNEGKGTTLGDDDAKSDSIKRSIDSLKAVDTLMLGTSREMAASLKSIDSQIGGFAALLVRTGDINASGSVDQGFKTNAIGSVLGAAPLIGGFIKSLFGTKTTVVGSGLFGGAQSLEEILGSGFDASYYSDVQKKKKFLGLTTSTKYSTQYASADAELENQFTLILRQFNDAILAASGPLGVATDDIQKRLNSFVVDIGKIDLQGLTGDEIEEKLAAVFGAAADDMAAAAFPGFERFQSVGEGLFETLVRVASTVESVTSSLSMLGSSASLMSIDLKMALTDQFDSVSAFTSAIDDYFETYYSQAEQLAARTGQFADVFDSLGLAMPDTLAGFRALVEAQDLTSAAGQATYATLLQLAPAFAELQSSMNGAKSAADIVSERQDLQRRLLEAQGDTQAIRALDLAKLDESNRALQNQIWALQDAKEAADAAQQLKDAWTSVGDSIMDEVRRIRGLTDASGGGSFASLMGQFNAATTAARGGDQDAASSLPGLSQALLQAAEQVATSRQELDRVQAQTAASLAETYAAIMAAGGSGKAVTGAADTGSILTAAATATQATAAPSASDALAGEVRALREEVAQLRSDNNAGHAATAGNTGAIKRKLEDVTAASGGEAVSVAGVAA